MNVIAKTLALGSYVRFCFFSQGSAIVWNCRCQFARKAAFRCHPPAVVISSHFTERSWSCCMTYENHNLVYCKAPNKKTKEGLVLSSLTTKYLATVSLCMTGGVLIPMYVFLTRQNTCQ